MSGPAQCRSPRAVDQSSGEPWGGTSYGLLGTLSHSGRTRQVLTESMDQPHLIEAMHGVLCRLGGTAREWRTDRLAPVIVPGSA
jgi:hypothetical protein